MIWLVCPSNVYPISQIHITQWGSAVHGIGAFSWLVRKVFLWKNKSTLTKIDFVATQLRDFKRYWTPKLENIFFTHASPSQIVSFNTPLADNMQTSAVAARWYLHTVPPLIYAMVSRFHAFLPRDSLGLDTQLATDSWDRRPASHWTQKIFQPIKKRRYSFKCTVGYQEHTETEVMNSWSRNGRIRSNVQWVIKNMHRYGGHEQLIIKKRRHSFKCIPYRLSRTYRDHTEVLSGWLSRKGGIHSKNILEYNRVDYWCSCGAD